MTDFVHDEPCDWKPQGSDEACGATLTDNPGDIYYACEEHYEDMKGWLMEGVPTDE